MKLPLFPGVGLVVVALGALDLHAHEDPRYLAGHFHGLSLVGQRERDGPVLVVLAGGRDHSRDDFVPRFIGLKLLGEPVLEHVEPHLRRIFAGRVEHDHVAPVLRPVVGVFGTAEQRVDQPGALVLGAVAAGTIEPAWAWAAGRRRRNKSGGHIRRRSSDVAGSTLGLFLVKYWVRACRAPPKSGWAATPIGTDVWGVLSWPARLLIGSRWPDSSAPNPA